MEYTNTGLVAHCKKALQQGWFYLWGSFAQIATQAVIDNNIKQYPSNSVWRAYASKAIGKTRVCDCYGLVKSYLWWVNDNSNPKYNAIHDVNTLGAYNRAQERGPLITLPEIPGVILYMTGHVGVYIGNGEFIECAGGGVGMRKGTIKNGVITSGSKFTHWFKDVNITYSEPVPTTEDIIYRMEKAVSFDKQHWINVLNGKTPANPLYLKMIINRILGKSESGTALSAENVLDNIKPYATSLDYWKKVIDGKEAVNLEWLKTLFNRILR